MTAAPCFLSYFVQLDMLCSYGYVFLTGLQTNCSITRSPKCFNCSGSIMLAKTAAHSHPNASAVSDWSHLSVRLSIFLFN